MDDPGGLAPDPVRSALAPRVLNEIGLSTVGGLPRTRARSPLSRRRWILETPIALYRKADGGVVALHNRCPHRWAPLALGEVQGDDLVCPYHGLQFAPSGQCVKFLPSPPRHQPSEYARFRPRNVRVRVDLDRRRDESQSRAHSFRPGLSEQSNWHTVWGYQAVNANFMQLKENVLDLTHSRFCTRNHSALRTGTARLPSKTYARTFRQIFEWLAARRLRGAGWQARRQTDQPR